MEKIISRHKYLHNIGMFNNRLVIIELHWDISNRLSHVTFTSPSYCLKIASELDMWWMIKGYKLMFSNWIVLNQ